MAGVRRSGRISKQIPIILLGTDTSGRVFSEETHTLVLSLHGAGIRSRNKFAPNEVLTMRPGDLRLAPTATAVAVKESPAPSSAASQPKFAAGGKLNLRRHVRTRVNFTACVRLSAASEEIVECDNISKGGPLFSQPQTLRSKRLYRSCSPLLSRPALRLRSRPHRPRRRTSRPQPLPIRRFLHLIFVALPRLLYLLPCYTISAP